MDKLMPTRPEVSLFLNFYSNGWRTRMLPFSLSVLTILAVALVLLVEESFCTGDPHHQQVPQIRRSRPTIPRGGLECLKPYFPNGVLKANRLKNMVRYSCSTEFQMIGNMYSFCINGRWDSSVPICVKAGCSDLNTVQHGQLSFGYEQAMVMLICSPGYQIAGSSKAHCNGTHWDRPLGSCQEMGISLQKSCDFEVSDYCGWTNDATHDFDWKRSDGIMSPEMLETGPKYDHTTMIPLAGHFMLVDSAEQLTNKTARLLSPMYPANYSQSACFRFFYHMYGDQIGSLTVYVKPSSMPLDSLTAKDVQFHKNTNQGNIWNEGIFKLKELSESFQIVIEAKLGKKYNSDIAIDDVSLLTGSDCRPGEGQDGAQEISSTFPYENLLTEALTIRCGAKTKHPCTVTKLQKLFK